MSKRYKSDGSVRSWRTFLTILVCSHSMTSSSANSLQYISLQRGRACRVTQCDLYERGSTEALLDRRHDHEANGNSSLDLIARCEAEGRGKSGVTECARVQARSTRRRVHSALGGGSAGDRSHLQREARARDSLRHWHGHRGWRHSAACESVRSP